MDPIEVKAGAAPEMLVTAARYVVAGIGGWVVGKGWFTADQWVQIGGALVTAVPLAWGVYASFRNKKKLVAVASAASNKVAVVK